jgi:flagellar biosynthesis regulator FlaF
MSGSQLQSMSTREQDAFALTEAAVRLDQARGKEANLAAALEQNLQLWVAIRTLVSRPGNALPAQIRNNLVSLSGFVAETTWRDGVAIPATRLDTLININLQIAEGLLQRGEEAANDQPQLKRAVN